ncbi:hypothetical protein Hanom_Chr03g00239201 [Helianthus anomalus]
MKLELELELGSVQAYLFELELKSLNQNSSSARAILRTTSNELKARLELASISLKRGKARLEFDSPMLSSLLLYYKKKKFLFGLV